MSNSLLSTILLVATLGCIVASLLSLGTMIAEINCKRDARSQLSYLNRDFRGTLDSHRQLYPKSTLRGAAILAIGLSVAFGLGFTLVQGLQH
jgi:hypothetical protein